MPQIEERAITLTDTDIAHAENSMQAKMASGPRATAARYDRRRARLVVSLDNGLELSFPPALAEGLDKAEASELAVIEISPTGLGLHWPKLDADLYLLALMAGVLGSANWMAPRNSGDITTKPPEPDAGSLV